MARILDNPKGWRLRNYLRRASVARMERSGIRVVMAKSSRIPFHFIGATLATDCVRILQATRKTDHEIKPTRHLKFLVPITLSILLWGCDDFETVRTSRVLEIKCRVDGLNQDKECVKSLGAGAELKVTVNTHTQKVQISVIKNDGTWWVKDLLIENCSVVDATNWSWRPLAGTNQTVYQTLWNGSRIILFIG